METTVHVAQAAHTRVLQQCANSLRIVKSTLNRSVSCHVIANSTTFQSVLAFHNLALEEKCENKSFIGSVEGDLCVSVNAAYKKPEEQRSKKRRADVESEDAERAISKIKKSGKDAEQISDASYQIAQECVSSLLKMKGANLEPCLESWALSLRKPGEYGAASSPDGRPSLVIAARFTGGVAVPIASLLSTFKSCRDGMLSTSTDDVNRAFKLPMSEQCEEGHERGQRSILLLASVPHVADEKER